MIYGQYFNTKETPQAEKIPGSDQVENSAGGFAFAVDDWVRLDRFLVLGSEGGSYYATEKKLTKESAEAVLRCIQTDGVRTVNRIVEISEAGRAPKNDPAIFALAMATGLGDDKTRAAALVALPRVCRIGTHLFHFAQAVQGFRGWGRGLRTAVGNWYLNQTPDHLALQLAKYQQRDGWSHRDLLRLSHPKGSNREIDGLLRWAVGKEAELTQPILRGFALAQTKVEAKPKEAAKIITDYKLPRECVPTEWLKHVEVWEALLVDMPVTAVVRNLGNMSKCELLKPFSDASRVVCARLVDREQIERSRIHPIQLLIALRTYSSGHGLRGSGAWAPVPQVVNALDNAYYLAFANVESTGKRWYLGLDISGSMWGGNVAGVPDFSPAEASGAMAMVTVAAEEQFYAVGFTAAQGNRHGTGMTPIALTKKDRLDSTLKKMEVLRSRMGNTDCALPMLDALEKRLPVDVFVIYTDSETWAGAIYPVQALRQYRDKTGIPAKLIVVGMVSNGFSIADPDDSGMMDVVGFDTAVPQLMANFVR